jgi:hypothetical protein
MKQIQKDTLHLTDPTTLLEMLFEWRQYRAEFVVQIIVELQARNLYTPLISDHVKLIQNIDAICKSHLVNNVNDLILLFPESSKNYLVTTNGIYDASVRRRELIDEFGLCWGLDQ